MQNSEELSLGMEELFKETFSVFKDNLKIFIPISSIIVIILVVSTLIFGILFAAIAVLSILYEGNVTIFIVLISLSLIIIFLSTYSWVYASLVSAIKNLEGEEVIAKSLKEGFSLILLFSILFVFYGILVSIGFAFLILPGVFFYTWYFFFPYFLVFEELEEDNFLTSIFNPLSRSKRLVGGYFMPVFARLFVFWLVSLVVGILFSIIPLGILLFYMVYLPFKTIFGYLLYKDLKRIGNSVR